ncbi:tetratricopeptide repeat protein [Aliivibrio wodanis]|uniref:tetratricopeptide repeat protein n=1 Tax=Aliivibrio wodanis TaxID=80852 RepID=UPI00406D124A
MKTIKKISLCIILSTFLVACASKKEKPSQYEQELYDGKPIETLTQEELPKTEVEAIVRGDKALKQDSVDLALYEYIRSLSYPEAKYQGRTLVNIGKIHELRGTDSLAEAAYLMSLDLEPNGVVPLERLGAIYTKKGLVKEGRSYFYRALNADQIRLQSNIMLKGNSDVFPEDVHSLHVDDISPALAYMGLGILSDTQGDHKLAEQFYKKALKIKPNSIKILINFGYSYYMNANYVDAKIYTMWALKRSPENEKAQNNLALIYLAQGQIKRSINVFMRHMKDYEALNNVGYFLILQGRPEIAVPYLEQAIDKKASYYKIANENLNRALVEMRIKKEGEDNSLRGDEPIMVSTHSQPIKLINDIGDKPKIEDILATRSDDK